MAVKHWIKKYFGWNQNFIACISVLLAALVMGSILFGNPRVGTADFGEYDETLYRMGLSRTVQDEADENKYFSKVIEQYEITGIDNGRLTGSIPTESMVYPIALVSAVCSITKQNFNTTYLMSVYFILMLLSVYVIIKSTYTFLKNRAIALTMLLCLCIFTSDILVPFNSLYADGMIVVSFFMFLATVMRALVRKKDSIWNMLFVYITAYLFLTSHFTMPLMIIPLLPFLVYLVVKTRPEGGKKGYHYFLSSLGGIILFCLCINFIINSEQVNNRINLYAATYDGAFTVAENQEEALRFFELPEEYTKDIGKSYYLSEDSYVMPPYSEEAEEKIFSHLSYKKLLQYYLTYPQDFQKLIASNLSVTSKVNTEKYLYIGKDGKSNTDIDVEKMGYYPVIRNIIMPTTIPGILLFFLLGLIGIIARWIYCKVHKRDNAISYLLLFLVVVCVFRICITTFITGTFENASNLFSYMFLTDILVVVYLMGIIQTVCSLSAFLNEERLEEVAEPAYAILENSPIIWLKKKIHRGMQWIDKHIWSNATWGTVVLTGAAFLVIGIVLFLPDRIGAYNNGDFGRMMDAMGLYYTDYDLLHQDEQYVTKVIENYVWLDNFDWSSITFLNPTMSQVFLALFVKLTAGAMGFQYSTVYATVIYMLLLVGSFAACLWGLYQLFGKKAAAYAAIMIIVLFGSYNLGWFNSLFSEATEMTGYLMVLGGSLWIMSRKQGTIKWYEWVLFMGSIRFFVGAKSQVTPEIIFLGIWAVILAVYHRPTKEGEKNKKRIANYIIQIILVTGLVVMTARSALIIYEKDGAISSQDTIYSSIFSGVLMVADNPELALTELGLDESLIEDKGKNPYLGEGAYYCQPRTEMAEEMIYSKVNTFDVLGWYLKHPKQLLKMLDHAAAESAAKMPDYFLYSGEKTTQQHRTVSKFNFWGSFRASVTPKAFWQYFVLYGVMVIVCFVIIIRRQTEKKYKLFAVFFLIIILSGAMQFPLSVIGNGFIDNIKQLFMFRLIHDIIIVSAGYICFVWIWNILQTHSNLLEGKKEVVHEQQIICSDTLLQRRGSIGGDSNEDEEQDDRVDDQADD